MQRIVNSEDGALNRLLFEALPPCTWGPSYVACPHVALALGYLQYAGACRLVLLCTLFSGLD